MIMEKFFEVVGVLASTITLCGIVFYIFWFFKEIWPDFEERFKKLESESYRNQNRMERNLHELKDKFDRSERGMCDRFLRIEKELRELEGKVELQRPASRAEKSD